jgi:beta-glucanase (GH16 family)
MGKKVLYLFIGVFFMAFEINAQDYVLVWEDNFNGSTLDSNHWNIEQRAGVWNTGGNKELQHYRKGNVTVGDDGKGNNCLILTAKREDYKGYSFTSGRVNSKSKFSVRHGKIEARIKIPDLANGLWPAFWTLGYTPSGWPDCGEIDILEMGHSEGISASSQNRFVGAHLHWAPYPSDYGTSYTSTENLNDDFHLYQLEWTENQIKIYIDDHLYFTMNIDGPTTEEFRDYSHYLILNLAVGGSLPGIFSSSEVTAPLPAKMYIDYVKVYQENNIGQISDSGDTLFGNFGVYEETAPVNANLDKGFDASILANGLKTRQDETPKEGDRALSYYLQADNLFNLKIKADVNRNMIRYRHGSIQFWIKTQFSDTIWAGLSDTLNHEAFVALCPGGENNPERSGEWQLAWIQLEELSEAVDLCAIQDMFILKGKPTSNNFISLDRVVWYEEPYFNILGGYYGVFAEHKDLNISLDYGNGGNIYIWSGFSGVQNTSPFYGADVLSFEANTNTWNGFGIHSDNEINLSNFMNGAMHFSYRTSSTVSFEIGLKNSSDFGWKYTFSDNELLGDNHWHQYTLPLDKLTSTSGSLTANDLKDILIPFYLIGTLDISIDEVYFSSSGIALEYPGNSTKIEHRFLGDKFSIYPNPAQDDLFVKGTAPNSTICIFDAQGRVFYRGAVCFGDQIDISRLCPGYYMVQASNVSGIQVLKFIVKQ